jgi:ABC-type Mn2+/Zn2+ transport system permease subunit
MIENQFFYSLVTAIFVGGAAGYLGTLMVTKRMALVGDALGHVALPGVALALTYNLSVEIGAFASLFIGVVLIWMFKGKTEIHMETLTGVVFAVSLALAFLIIPSEDIETALIGDITKISITEAFISVFLVIIVFFVIKKIFSEMILSTMSEDLALSRKINVRKYDLIYLLAIGIIVALGIKIVGSLLVGALVVIPAAASRNFSRNLFQYSYGGMLIGAASCILGVVIFKIVGFGAGPFAVLSSAVIFLTSVFFKQN